MSPTGNKRKTPWRMPTMKDLKIRVMEYTEITKSELIVAGFVLAYSLAAVVLRIVQSPDDPFEHRLRAEIQRRIDSVAAVRDSLALALPEGEHADISNGTRHTFPERSRSKKKQAPAQPMDLNTTSHDSLCLIPGIGSTLASRIEEQRKRKPFRSVKELRTVRGIGPRLYAKIAPHLSVQQPRKKHR